MTGLVDPTPAQPVPDRTDARLSDPGVRRIQQGDLVILAQDPRMLPRPMIGHGTCARVGMVGERSGEATSRRAAGHGAARRPQAAVGLDVVEELAERAMRSRRRIGLVIGCLAGGRATGRRVWSGPRRRPGTPDADHHPIRPAANPAGQRPHPQGRPVAPFQLSALAGAGALRSTAADLLCLLRATLDPARTRWPLSLNAPSFPGSGWPSTWR
jgi:hypothetical protein